MKKYIVTISVDYSNARKVCELIENQAFDTLKSLRKYLNLHLKVEEEDINQPQMFTLSEFMEECNDQYLNLEEVFISYITIKN